MWCEVIFQMFLERERDLRMCQKEFIGRINWKNKKQNKTKKYNMNNKKYLQRAKAKLAVNYSEPK